MGFGLVYALLVSIIIFHVMYHALKKITPLVINAVFGIIVFWMVNHFGIVQVPIDLLSTLIAAFGGVFGVMVIVGLSLLGIPP